MITNQLIEGARRHWQDTIDLNPDAGIISTLREYLADTDYDLSTEELNTLAFEILITTR